MTQYEMQVLQADIRMLLATGDATGDDPIEVVAGTGANGKAYAVLHTNSLAELASWREVLQANGRPHRLVNRAYDYRQEVNDPDW
ncbi:hypothetical protein QYH69_10165 [Paraburkholderia sp. SARCC-3016]|jgi:hypothetical protein|uniref:hypothetical protein n=1 Tax=Paraburkholderia sp. SARCC-3016 TaxID=3058611 RepID=UPI002809C789|nr:hypothetical protein [Paraburkholderia sp. SARCC-3016]MDQ7977602.1 hypothetical protein [Paraburkholderia sp. SARCC-3016]